MGTLCHLRSRNSAIVKGCYRRNEGICVDKGDATLYAITFQPNETLHQFVATLHTCLIGLSRRSCCRPAILCPWIGRSVVQLLRMDCRYLEYNKASSMASGDLMNRKMPTLTRPRSSTNAGGKHSCSRPSRLAIGSGRSFLACANSGAMRLLN
jgi:hypothetical protein